MHIIADFAVWLQSRGWSDAWTFAFCFNASYVVVVWGLTLLFAAIDHWNLLDRWKIQKGKWPEAALHKEAFKEQALRTFTNFGVLWVLYTFALTGRVRMSGPMDSWPVFAAKGIALFLWLDFSFYWEHRLSHHPSVYRFVHKQHHMSVS